MARHETGVEAETAFDSPEVFPEAAPIPGNTRFQAGHRHAFHPGKHVQQVGCGLGAQRRDAEAAVPADNRGDAVVARGRQRRVPEYLGVVVGVDVHKARRHHAAVGIDDAPGGFIDPAHRYDAPIADAEIAPLRRRAGGRRATRRF